MLTVVILTVYIECHCAECLYTECHYAECLYTECHCAECHGTTSGEEKYFKYPTHFLNSIFCGYKLYLGVFLPCPQALDSAENVYK
jgi:hypothetical protein